MPVLDNPKHELFAQALAKGKTQAEAYELAGYKPSEPNASRLTRHDKVQARVAEIQGRAAERAEISKAWVLEKLVENAARAMQHKAVLDEDGEPIGEYRYEGGVANRALELVGKELGMFVDRKEIRTGQLDDLDATEREQLRQALRDELARRAGGTGPTGTPGKAGDVRTLQ